jgi:hypothetical protein
MTPAEKATINLLAEAWNSFLTLPEQHIWDHQEMMHLIHGAQRIIMQREARRNNPDIFAIPEHLCTGCGSKGYTGQCDQCIPY